MFLPLTRPFDSRDMLDVRHSAGNFPEKIQRATQKMPFNGRCQRKLQVRKMEARVVFDSLDDLRISLAPNRGYWTGCWLVVVLGHLFCCQFFPKGALAELILFLQTIE
jgi:hypothetical protein